MAKVILLAPNAEELSRMVDVIKIAWDLAKTNDSFADIDEGLNDTTQASIWKHFEEVMSQYLPLGTYLNFIWSVEEVPRAFMDQLDRHHSGHYWEQSFRVLDLTNYALRHEGYYTPQYIRGIDRENALKWIEFVGILNMSIETNKKRFAAMIYHSFMLLSNKVYNKLIQLGMPTEQARGVIPLHVNTRTTFSMPWYFGLREMLGKRSCFISQGEYWFPVINGMISELRRIHFPDGLIKQMTTPPCKRAGHCTVEKNMLERLDDDPNDLCPLYIKDYNKTDKTKDELIQISLAKNPQYREVAYDYFRQINDPPLLQLEPVK